MPDMLIAAGVAQDQFACWARAATGIVLAAIAWVGFLGVRTAYRQRRDGRVTAGNVTGTLSVVGVVAAIVLFWFALTTAF